MKSLPIDGLYSSKCGCYLLEFAFWYWYISLWHIDKYREPEFGGIFHYSHSMDHPLPHQEDVAGVDYMMLNGLLSCPSILSVESRVRPVL